MSLDLKNIPTRKPETKNHTVEWEHLKRLIRYIEELEERNEFLEQRCEKLSENIKRFMAAEDTIGGYDVGSPYRKHRRQNV